jgi:hypothetical protein
MYLAQKPVLLVTNQLASVAGPPHATPLMGRSRVQGIACISSLVIMVVISLYCARMPPRG